MLNERAVRAGAGLLFLFAMIAFMNAWLTGNFAPTRVFVVAFLIDFALRLFVNPRYALSLIVGQWLVRRQQPEWAGAPQKRFAWGIGFVLALVMLWLVVVQQVVGPVNLLVCALCLTLLFFETAFGICIGCKLHAWIARAAPQACPGDVCTAAPNPPGAAALAAGARRVGLPRRGRGPSAGARAIARGCVRLNHRGRRCPALTPVLSTLGACSCAAPGRSGRRTRASITSRGR
jgi:hypothetical protein